MKFSAIATLAMLGLGKPLQASTVIGFEDGSLSGWTTAGEPNPVSVVTNWNGGFTAPYGNNFAVLGAGCSTNTMTKTFVAQKGCTIEGSIAWDGNDHIRFNDSGVLTLYKSSNQQTLFYADIATYGYYGNSQWNSFTHLLPADGEYTLVASATNGLDCVIDSYLLLDTCKSPDISVGGPYLLNLGETSSVTLAGTVDGPGAPTYTTDCPFSTISGNVLTAGSETTPGVCSVTMTVTDSCGTSTQTAIVVIVDPAAGFVTGGGWIPSPVGAYTLDSTIDGKGEFGFVSKYKKGQSVPSGDTQFTFSAADFDFESTFYEWLVITGSDCAKYKGEGLVNGAGSYGFMLTACDGDVSGTPDSFRIKIWDRITESTLYNNQMGASDDGYEGTELGGGKIQVHQPKKKTLRG